MLSRWRGDLMKRPQLLAITAAVIAVFQSVLAVAQPSERVRSVGVLIGIAENDPDAPRRTIALHQGLRELGWIQGENVRVFFRWSADPDLIPLLAKEVVSHQPDIIVASSSLVLATLLRETRTTPIIFVTA